MYHIFPSYHYYEHPTDSNYLIYTFRKKEMSDHFAQKLEESSIKFETDTDLTPQKKELFHFAILQSDRDVSMDLFYKTWGEFREPFIKGFVFKILLLVVFIALMSLAMIGYLKNS